MMKGPGSEGPGSGQGGRGLGGAPSQGTASLWPWMGFRDTRIVRVCRSSGGKDRHSKVATIRGLRDRRVRLSVETALKLYDLQDKLGLGQPSKVVDWLLNAARHEIDKLPPLPFVPASYMRCPPASLPPPYGAGLHKDISLPAVTDMIGGVAPGPPLTLLPVDHLGDDGFLIRRAAMLQQDGEEPRSAVALHLPHPHCSSTYASYSGYVVPQTLVEDQLQAPPYGYRPMQLLLCPTAAAPSTFSPYAALPPPSNYDPGHVNGFYMGYSGS